VDNSGIWWKSSLLSRVEFFPILRDDDTMDNSLPQASMAGPPQAPMNNPVVPMSNQAPPQAPTQPLPDLNPPQQQPVMPPAAMPQVQTAEAAPVPAPIAPSFPIEQAAPPQVNEAISTNATPLPPTNTAAATPPIETQTTPLAPVSAPTAAATSQPLPEPGSLAGQAAPLQQAAQKSGVQMSEQDRFDHVFDKKVQELIDGKRTKGEKITRDDFKNAEKAAQDEIYEEDLTDWVNQEITHPGGLSDTTFADDTYKETLLELLAKTPFGQQTKLDDLRIEVLKEFKRRKDAGQDSQAQKENEQVMVTLNTRFDEFLNTVKEKDANSAENFEKLFNEFMENQKNPKPKNTAAEKREYANLLDSVLKLITDLTKGSTVQAVDLAASPETAQDPAAPVESTPLEPPAAMDNSPTDTASLPTEAVPDTTTPAPTEVSATSDTAINNATVDTDLSSPSTP
jgi:hypothetical protein